MDDIQPVILFVDDSVALLRVVERMLTLEGFHVLLAADGEEALQHLREANPLPDLIISDIGMPQMDGFAFFEAVRSNQAWLEIPFLFLTARDAIDDLRRGYSLGVDDYLVKPLDQERLLLVVRSKLKRRSELADHLQAQREAIEAARHNLTSMVAHELRTPLSSINIVAEILAQEFDQMTGAQVQKLLEALQGGSARMSRLVEQTVMYVQLQSGALVDSIAARRRACPVHELILDAVERARRQDYRHREGHVLVRELNPEALTHGDMPSLCHALAEILLNAVIFSPPDAVISIEQRIVGGMVQIAVNDTGPGIAPGEIARVMEPFQQANRVRFEQQGIGLGLALARGIVDVHGGSLRIDSEIGRGTSVTISLPLHRPGR